jgi:hypothetical protein
MHRKMMSLSIQRVFLVRSHHIQLIQGLKHKYLVCIRHMKFDLSKLDIHQFHNHSK